MSTKRTKNKKKDEHKKREYKGPFPFNKNFEIETTRKYMKPNSDGPTVDEFSYQDTTDSVDSSEAVPQKKQSKRPRKKRNIIGKWLQQHVSEIIIGIVVFVFTAFISTVVFKHSNHLVEHDKDIEFIKDSQSEVKKDIHDVDQQVESLKDKVHEIDKRVEVQDVQLNNKKR